MLINRLSNRIQDLGFGIQKAGGRRVDGMWHVACGMWGQRPKGFTQRRKDARNQRQRNKEEAGEGARANDLSNVGLPHIPYATCHLSPEYRASPHSVCHMRPVARISSLPTFCMPYATCRPNIGLAHIPYATCHLPLLTSRRNSVRLKKF